MLDQKYLLTDDQMRRFISHGYLKLKADFPREFHETLSGKIEEVMDKEGNPGNNILPRVTETRQVFEHPVIQGALTSVLGPSYIMHPHRHCHFSRPGRTVQHWHKDSYWGYQKVRNHHPWWAMIFYYPQDVDEEMGPSAIMPGTQYYAKRAGDESEQEEFLLGEAGSFALIHYDLWHKGTGNISQRNRSMMKFQFIRMDAPTAPTWNNQQETWKAMNGDGPPTSHEPIWQHQWDWFSGKSSNGTAQADVDLAALRGALDDDYEPNSVDAAYRLSAAGTEAIPTLLDALHGENKAASRNAGYGFSALGTAALTEMVDSLQHRSEQARGHAAFALSEMAESAAEAVPALNARLDDESAWVRRNVVEALGTIKVPSDQSVSGLIQGLGDADDQVRFTSALALTRIGPDAAEAVPALGQALEDENRYVRSKSVEALRRIGTPEAQEVAFDYLMAAHSSIFN